MDLDRIARNLKDNADALARTIVERYGEIGAAEKWLNLPPGLDQDHLPELIVALVEATLESDFEATECRRLVDVAALHGYHRREDGLAETLVFTEYHLLRRVLWELVDDDEDGDGDPRTAFQATLDLDEGIGLATAASLHGYHRPEFEESGRWPGAVEELLASWPGFHG